MSKRLAILLAVVVVVSGIGWFTRGDLLLALVSYQSTQKYADVAPTRTIPWQSGPAVPSAAPGERAPNIILIVADDLGYNDISTFGGGVAGMRTPSIDRLAAEGTVFTQAYSGASTCAPSRAMIMTGRYATRTGFEFTPTPAGFARIVSTVAGTMDSGLPASVYNEAIEEGQPPYERQGLPASEVTIAETLSAHGYYTAHIGKWHLGRENGMAPHQQGFDDSLLMHSGLYLPKDDPHVVNAPLPFDPIDKFLWAGMGFSTTYNSGDSDKFAPGGYLTDYWTDESINVITANQHRPFFLYLAHWGPHTPLQATREDYDALRAIEPHRKRVYAGMIRAVDRSVGRILDTLDALDIADNTVVVFTSDNGGAGYIGIPTVNSPFRGFKITMFEGGLRVPLFVKWPAKMAAGTVVDTPVAHIDVMPTLAAAAQAPVPEELVIDGLSLLPLATPGGAESWTRDTLFWQNGHYQVVRQGDWKLQVNDRPTDGLQTWLYNLASDPTEQNNLAKSRPDKRKALEAALALHQASARAPLYPSVVQMPVMVDKTLAEKFIDGDEYVYTPN